VVHRPGKGTATTRQYWANALVGEVFVDKGRTIQCTTRILVLRTEKPFDASAVLDATQLAED
jgi:hypothetical protein